MGFIKDCQFHKLQVKQNYSLKEHTAYKTEALAEYFARPRSKEELILFLELTQHYSVPLSILGAGSNVLAPDTGIVGLVLTLSSFKEVHLYSDRLQVESGAEVRAVSAFLANKGKKCLEFLYGMPGSIGGACWMNARSYGKEISEVLLLVKGLKRDGKDWEYPVSKEDFSYKNSPFQKGTDIITECTLKICDAPSAVLWKEMLDHEFDRRSKGHYLGPCAGSVFKNNYTFGAPSGKLLDALGYRGRKHNGAMVNPKHANIIINTGKASADDIYALSSEMQAQVKKNYGFDMEYEIILLGERAQWQQKLNMK